MPTTAQRRAQLVAERQVQAQSVQQRNAQYRQEMAGVLAEPRLTRHALIRRLVPLILAYGGFQYKAGYEQAELDTADPQET